MLGSTSWKGSQIATGILLLGVCFCLVFGCRGGPTSQVPQLAVTLSGVVTDADSVPVADALLTITESASGTQVEVLKSDARGAFEGRLRPGSYAIATSSSRGYSWIEKISVPNTKANISLSRDCSVVKGRLLPRSDTARANLTRKSQFIGDTFFAAVGKDGAFELCLPAGHYRTSLAGSLLAPYGDVEVPAVKHIEIRGFPGEALRTPPRTVTHIPARLTDLVSDIVAARPTLIGLGESTHGTSEFFTARSTLTFELVRRANVRLLLLESDAIASAALDDYVTGGDVDIVKAVAELQTWPSDTHEFLKFLRDLREYNATATQKVRVWGIDVQNITKPVEVLLSPASKLSITADEQNVLRLASANRGRGARELTAEQHSMLAGVLDRAGKVDVADRQGLLIGLAARSLDIQFHYWDNEGAGDYSIRRDIGMADIAAFLTSHVGSGVACIWAHVAHVSKQRGDLRMGHFLATRTYAADIRYYAVGFYMHQGSARAWDSAGAIGVISHPMAVAPSYTVEDVFMTAAGMPDIAWVALRDLPAPLRTWLNLPRFVRELTAVYAGDEEMLTLRDLGEALDAVVIVKVGHDSSPTATGIRSAKPH